MSLSRGLRSLSLALVFMLCSAAAVFSQEPLQELGGSAAQPVRIANSTHPLAKTSLEAGRVESSRSLGRMLLLLQPTSAQEAALEALLSEQQNPRSPQFHQWLTAAEFGARFGVTDVDLAPITAWLAQNGFSEIRVAPGRRAIEFTGSVSQAEAALQTEFHYYKVGANLYFANSKDISLPDFVAARAHGILSLNNFGKRPPRHEFRGIAGREANGKRSLLSPTLTASGQSTTYYLAPGDFAAIYNTKPLLSSGNDGTGVSIAIAAQSQFELTDVQAFRTIFGLKTNDPDIYVSGPDPGLSNPLDAEETQLDVEWAGGIAPGARIKVIIAGSTDTTSGVDLAAQYAVDNELAPILVYTYGSCEQALGPSGNAFYKSLWQQAAAEGITVVVATGDNGAAGCDAPSSGLPATNGPAVNGVAATPYNLAVGGAQFSEGVNPATYWSASNATDYSSALGYIPESAWNESCDPGQPTSATNCYFGTANFSLLSGSGGASSVYSKPAWQIGTGVPADNARDLPDVVAASASAHDDIVLCNSLNGTPCQINAQQQVVGLTLVGGTSASAPAMAGMLALLEQKNGGPLGLVNYTFYKLAQTKSCDSSQQTNPTAVNSCVFYDITAGSNSVPCAGNSPGCSSTKVGVNGLLAGYSATAGYDMATGLGSINLANLASSWNSISFLPSQVTLNVPSTSFAHGTAVTLSGSVAPSSGNGTPTGSVILHTDQYGDVATIPLTNGSFTLPVQTLPGGQYTLRGHYAGDAMFAASDSSFTALSVTPEASNTTLAVNGLTNGTAGFGAPLLLKVMVKGASAQGTATGTVTIADSPGGPTINLGTFPLTADGAASIPAGALLNFAPGTHSLTASYSGDNSFTASSSQAVRFTIGKSSPLVVVGANSSNVPAGQSVGIHVVVAGPVSSPVATGQITLTDNGVAIGSKLQLQPAGIFGEQAQAATVLPNLAPGMHTIDASYDGTADPNYQSVAAGDPNFEFPAMVNVTSAGPHAATITSMAPKSLPVNLGDNVDVIVSVTPAAATGTVTIWDAAGPRGTTNTITGGSAEILFAWTQAGTSGLYAVYSGDSKYAPSSSTVTAINVAKGTPTVTITAPAATSGNQQVSINATVSGLPSNAALPYPTGTLQLMDSVNGGGWRVIDTRALTAGAGRVAVSATRLSFAPGTHSLKYHYSGDTNWLATDSNVTPLASGDFSLSISPSPISLTAGSPGSGVLTVTPSGGFNDTVTLSCPTGGTVLPAGYACAFTPSASVVISNANPATTTFNLNVSATAGTFTPPLSNTPPRPTLPWTGLPALLAALAAFVALLLLATFQSTRSNAWGRFAHSALASAFLLGLILGCGGGGGGGGGGKVSSTTTLSSSNLRIGFTVPLQLNVTISANSTPTGSVQIYDNGVAFGTPIPVSAGIATLQTTNLPVGYHIMKAVYNGDSNTFGSTSSSINQVVLGAVPVQITGTSTSGIARTVTVNVLMN